MTLIGLAVLFVEAGAANARAGRRGELPWVALDAPRVAAGRVPARALDVPGRVRLRRPAVPDGLPADADHARRERVAGRGADLARPRRRARRGAVLARDARPDGAARRARCSASRRRTSRCTWSRRCWSSRSRCACASRCPFALGVAARAIGTVGLAAEWGWTQVLMPLPWPAALLPGGPSCSGFAMASPARASAPGWARGWRPTARRRCASAAVVGAVAIFALTGFALRLRRAARACAGPSPDRRGPGTATPTVRSRPPTAPTTPTGSTATAWQGGGLVVDRLERVAPGVYRTTEPIPVDGEWKTMIRLHTGNTLTALPVYLPADPAIPVEGVPAERAVRRATFGPEQQLLQRERKSDAPGWLWAVAYGVVLAIALGVPRRAGLGRAPRGHRGPPPSPRFERRRENPPPPERPGPLGWRAAEEEHVDEECERDRRDDDRECAAEEGGRRRGGRTASRSARRRRSRRRASRSRATSGRAPATRWLASAAIAGQADDHQRRADRAAERHGEPDREHGDDHEPAADAEEAGERCRRAARPRPRARSGGCGQAPSSPLSPARRHVRPRR